jgi:DNA-binding beta-propeller fold protein YncE
MDRRGFVVGTAALALAPRALARMLAATPTALVTADEEARLVAVDLATGRVRRYVRTRPKPRSIEAVGDVAVVAHSELGAITIVDASFGVRHTLGGLGEPRYTAAHPDGRHAYVSDAERGEVVVLDVLRGRIVGREPVGRRARHLGLHPNARRLWVALGRKAERIAVVDVRVRSRPRLLGTIRPPFLAHDVGFAPDGGRVWVSSGDQDELAVYDARNVRLLARVRGDAPPQHVTFEGERVYVTSGDSGTLRVHHVGGRLLRTTRVPTGSYNVQQAQGWVVTPGLGRGSLCILDAQGRLVRREQIARSSHDACIVAGRSSM